MYGRNPFAPVHYEHLCGLYYDFPYCGRLQKAYLPQVDVQVHASILATISRTRLQQTFQNPSPSRGIREVRYAFPLYDGVSVVGFQCHVGNRLIVGQVKEKENAKKVYKDAVERGETAGLLEQLPEASDVFTTTIGNIPPGAKVTVDITYLGELKHDMEVDGIRFTIPTSICPRYGNVGSSPRQFDGTIAITVDAEMAEGSSIQRLQSPSHPISMSMGTTSIDSEATPSMSKASTTLSLGVAHLDTDFVLQVVARDTGIPKAILETHPTIPNQHALMATLVPKFALPPEKPEIVFVCDQSGSMSGPSMNLAKEALQLLLKSLPLGVKFNICSFGSRYDFLFHRSASYSQDTLSTATRHAAGLSANYGGTEMLEPLRAAIQQRYKDMPLDIILLTDGEIWEQQALFDYLNAQIQATGAPIRVFTLGIGSGVSHSLIEGVAKAGNGFAQSVQEGEKMNSKVVRMLKGALSPHVNDYTLEVKYSVTSDDDFEVVEKVADSLNVALDLTNESPDAENTPKKISLFDTTSNPDFSPPETEEDCYSHLPQIPTPKILQAPQSIPSLFAFSRSTIYLLLSPSAPQATPTSVVLRGTSAHGPLELEIPVQVLREKGETIHQLAAKKAVSELEQGRGWLACARTPGGELLRNKFEGRFSNMVEREAVRLGVQFQVGGKWTSFVATEHTVPKPRASYDEDEPMDQDWESPEDSRAAELEAKYRQEIESGQAIQGQTRYGPESGSASSFSASHRGGYVTRGRGNPSSSLRALPSNAASQQRLVSRGTASKLQMNSGATRPCFGAAPVPPNAQAQLFGSAASGSAFASASSSLFGAPSASSNTSPFGPLRPRDPWASSAHAFAAPFAASADPTHNAKALQDYQTSLMVLHQGNSKRLCMAPAVPAFGTAVSTSAFTSYSPTSPSYSPSSPLQEEELLDEYMGGEGFGNTSLSPPTVLSSTAIPQGVPVDTSMLEQYQRAPLSASTRTETIKENDLDMDPNFGGGDTALENFDFDSFLHTGEESGGFGSLVGFNDSTNSAGTGTVAASFSSSSSSANKTEQAAASAQSVSPQDILHHLIAHQSFSGEFPYHPHVLGWLEISVSDFRRVDVDDVKGGCLLTTALVIVYMEKKLAGFKGEWELVVEKARSWLEAECVSDGCNAYLEVAASMI